MTAPALMPRLDPLATVIAVVLPPQPAWLACDPSVLLPVTRIEPTLFTVDSGTQKNVPPPLIVRALPPPLIVRQRLTCLPAATPIVDGAVIVNVLPMCAKESLKLCSSVPPASVMFPLPSAPVSFICSVPAEIVV